MLLKPIALRGATSLACATCLFGALNAEARPLHPDDGVVPMMSNDDLLKQEFTLFVDSDPAVKVIYYVPKIGYVSVDGTSSNDPKPRLTVNHRVMQRGYFEGETLSYLGGTLSTNGSSPSLQRLRAAAAAIGYTVAPAPVSKVATRFLVGTKSLKADAGGELRLDVDCQKVPGGTRPDGSSYSVDQCSVKGAESNDFDIGVDFLYRLVALPYHGSTIGGAIPFQAITLPGWDGTIDEKLSSGDNWDNLIQADLEWELESDQRTHKAVLDIHWESLFEQASAFAAVHLWSCVEAEIETFFQNIVTCHGTAEKCGVSVKWFDANGQSTDIPSNNAAFVSAVDELKKNLQDELFAQVAADSSVLGRVRKDATVAFTLRANYEKRSMTRNETREFYWNPGARAAKASTNLTIDCVQGTAGSRLGWANSAHCRELAGLASSHRTDNM